MDVSLSIVRANPTVLEGLGAHLEGDCTFCILYSRVLEFSLFCFYHFMYFGLHFPCVIFPFIREDLFL